MDDSIAPAFKSSSGIETSTRRAESVRMMLDKDVGRERERKVCLDLAGKINEFFEEIVAKNYRNYRQGAERILLLLLLFSRGRETCILTPRYVQEGNKGRS